MLACTLLSRSFCRHSRGIIVHGCHGCLAKDACCCNDIASGQVWSAEAATLCMQACANILQHTCVASEGQSGAGMWDTTSRKIHSILTGKVNAAAVHLPSNLSCCTALTIAAAVHAHKG